MDTQAFDFSTIKQLHEHLCLDFVNSTANHQNPSEDHLKSYADLLSWSQDVELLNAEEAERLWEVASQQPIKTVALHQKAVVLREAIYHTLLDAALDQPPNIDNLETLNVALTETMSHMRLVLSEDGFNWAWTNSADSLEYIIWRVVWAAQDLLRSDKLKYVRKCDGCDWLFLDVGRGHKRRWCDMNTCGNRAKARRHYLRTQGK
ncbi:MAG: ABATE domain-containing protein [Anaerolineae bacterium]|nr:ABATE domain-containing protein [Anaerolineae bacterium]